MMMRTTAVILLVCLAATTGLAQEANAAVNACETGLWGADCNNVCIGCKAGEGCDDKGVCTGDCAEGYAATSDGCKPTCFGVQGDAGCDNDGECVAPNYCICGKSGAQVVGVYREDHTTPSGQTAAGTQCISLRKDGIKGAFISLVIMVISIGFCGIIEVQRNKGKSRKE